MVPKWVLSIPRHVVTCKLYVLPVKMILILDIFTFFSVNFHLRPKRVRVVVVNQEVLDILQGIKCERDVFSGR